jgi:hypothetical protein
MKPFSKVADIENFDRPNQQSIVGFDRSITDEVGELAFGASPTVAVTFLPSSPLSSGLIVGVKVFTMIVGSLDTFSSVSLDELGTGHLFLLRGSRLRLAR